MTVDAHGCQKLSPPSSRAPSTVSLSASMASVTDSNRPKPPWHPPPIAYPTASWAASEVPSLPIHRCPPPSPSSL